MDALGQATLNKRHVRRGGHAMRTDPATSRGAGPGRSTLDATTQKPALARRGASDRYSGEQPDYAGIHAAALPVLLSLCARWLPDGRRVGAEYIARNPRRDDRCSGSMRVNLRSGRWADFALSNVRGGDVVSLAAYLHGLSQPEAARRLARMLEIGDGNG